VVSTFYLYNAQVRLGFSLVMRTKMITFLFGIKTTSLSLHAQKYNLLCRQTVSATLVTMGSHVHTYTVIVGFMLEKGLMATS
jgi:hypothetical protein